MEIYSGDNYRLNLSKYVEITKEDALITERKMESFEHVGGIETFIRYMGVKDRNRMVNSINFVHFYRKNKKELSYALRCVFNGIDYAIRVGSIESKSGTCVSDTILSKTLGFAYIQVRDSSNQNSLFRSIFDSMSPLGLLDNMYSIDTYNIIANYGADTHSVVNDIHSIHFIHTGRKINTIGEDLLKPKTKHPVDYTESKGNKTINTKFIKLMQKIRSKELKSFCIRLRNPLYLRRSTFKEIWYM